MKAIIVSVSLGALVTGGFFSSTAKAQNGPSHHAPLLAPRQAASAAAPWRPTTVALPLFDGRTLDGWIDQENSAGSLSGGDVKDLDGFAKKLAAKSDPVSVFLNEKLEDAVRADLTASNANVKAARSALVRNVNLVISGGPVYDGSRFKDVQLRPETKELLEKNPQGPELARLNKLLIEDAYPAELAKSPATGWVVKDGAIASTGAGRGTLYTRGDYGHFRLTFLMRHVSANPGREHQACVLIFCRRPKEGEKPLDAVGGIQFQVPNGGHWDYRPTENGVKHNNGGGAEFTNVAKPGFNVHEWSRVEIVANAKTGTARMAVAQPPDGKAVEVLDFKDATAGRSGPIALQMHNDGLFDEYKDIKIEVEPGTDDLLTAK